MDTDHVTVLQTPSGIRRTRLIERMAAVQGERFGVSIATVEEQMRGWLSTIARERQVGRQVKAYWELTKLFQFFAKFTILPFDDTAATHFNRLRPSLRRLGTMDLEIASTALAADVVLLTANR